MAMNENELQITIDETTSTQVAIINQQTYEDAGKLLVAIATRKKQVVDYWAEPKKKAHEAHKAITLKEKEMLTPLEAMESKVKKLMGDYYAAEQKRIAAEQARQEAEAAKMLALAAEAEAQGDTDTAQEATAVAVLEASKVSYAPSAQGTSTRMVWKWRVTDIDMIPDAYIVKEPDANILNALCKGAKGDKPPKAVSGVEFFREPVMTVRAR